MPRPSKEKRICRLPGCGFFVPGEGGQPTHRIRMTVEEYETIRLIDYMGYTQEECAVQMEVGRATVQAVYTEECVRSIIQERRFKHEDCSDI